MKTYEFRAEQFLPRLMDEVFPFFADAANLQTITPPWLRFRILTPSPIAMGVGTLIDYQIRIHGIPIRWRSRISAWNPPHSFTDEQIRGPYRLWVHEHTFRPVPNGTLAADHVRYAPLGGALMQRLFVGRDVRKIFAYRNESLKKIFAA